MAKDPAFLFYPNDWIGGTMGMTFEEKGAYMELLMLQFNRGHMTKHMIGQTVGQLWVKLEDKFVMDDKKMYYNVRLDEEKEKRKNWTNSRRNNVLGKNQYTKNNKNEVGHKKGHMTLHMENVNVNENTTSKLVFNNMPVSKNFNGLPDVNIIAAKEIVRITGHVNLSDQQVSDMWEVFKIQNLTGKKYYQDNEGVYSHFINWIKTQKFTNGQKNISAGRVQPSDKC